MGPTASGKTATALTIARMIPSEIISVDSALVYRGMDIGTAKPSIAEQAGVPHHLIDLIDPTQSYSAMQFRTAALQLVQQIIARGRMPLLVGGTMLYFKALRDGLDTLPKADPQTRSTLDAETALIGTAAMHAQLACFDPATAARLQPNDSQRIQRAHEIYRLTGQPMSALLALQAPVDLPFTLLPIALEPSQRAILHIRIAARFDAMLTPDQPNLLDEVRALRSRTDLHPTLPSMRCVGYRQAWEYLDGQIDLPTMREKAVAATRQLAKRQLTWLRGMSDRHVIDCLDPIASTQILDLIRAALAR